MRNTIAENTEMQPDLDLKYRIIELLHHDLERYTILQYVRGLLYLKIIVEDRTLTAYMERSKIFWDWWKMNWNQRDKAYINDGIESLGLTYRIMLYDELHNPHKMITENEFERSYEEMAQKIKDEIEKDTSH